MVAPWVLAVLTTVYCSATWSQASAPSSAGVDRQARVWAASCGACHGTEGRTQGAMPLLAGREAEHLATALLEFKRDQRPWATVMHQLAKGYSDDEIWRIARYFATLESR